VTAPEGVAEGLRELEDPDGHELAHLVREDRGLPAVERLGVYANAFFERLRGVLAKDFPALARALGDDAFHDLVRVYLMIHPPHRPSIRDAGAALAAFLRDDEVAAPFRRHLPCAGDLAAFEWVQTEVFDAPDASLLAREDLAAIPPEAWPELSMATIPALRTLQVAWPVQNLDPDACTGDAASLVRGTVFLRVWRYAERVRWREISDREHACLALVSRGARFGEVCEQLACLVGDDAAASEAAWLLGRWVADGCLRTPLAPLATEGDGDCRPR
jgi:hypothetical protein